MIFFAHIIFFLSHAFVAEKSVLMFIFVCQFYESNGCHLFFPAVFYLHLFGEICSILIVWQVGRAV